MRDSSRVLVEERKHAGCAVAVYYDQDPMDPWKDCDHLGGFVTWHRRYNIGDGNKDFKTLEDFEEWWAVHGGRGWKIPVYLYDHSGLTLRALDPSDFRAVDSAGWDWGLLGYMYCTKQHMREYFSVKRVTQKIVDQSFKALMCQVDEINRYLHGEYYCYFVEDQNGEIVGSCGSFDDSDYCMEEACREAEAHSERIEGDIEEAVSGNPT